ncbi:hypothetical protein [Aeromicrobium sp. HA]|nr:hypothetical protein [Aeromicrobium sp. HA]
MTYPRRPDRLNDNVDHRTDARSDGDYYPDENDQPTPQELAEMEADGW